MDTLSRGNVIRIRPSGDMPKDLDREALKILHSAGFRWDSSLNAFCRGASRIDYTFLRGQKLVTGASLRGQERTGQLQRLRILLQSID